MKTISRLALVICVLSLTACNLFKKNESPKDNDETVTSTGITDRKWKLVELDGKPVADSINGKEPFIIFHKKDNRYSASGGCNGLGGEFILEEYQRIKFNQGMSTMMACENMDIENGLKYVLASVDNYSLHGDDLSLNKARMMPLARFKAVK
ncbi:META domain-containing protein [Pedobacter sp.]|uniref:META domain-containing protein n=1 Tax=Pedobacter sp. TaxID=1411316 RepID=UPI003D7F95F5